MFGQPDNSNMAARRFDSSMSRRTRKPKIFTENTSNGEAAQNEKHSALRWSLKELMTENNCTNNSEEVSLKSSNLLIEAEKEKEVYDTGGAVVENSSLAIVKKKGSFVGKYMKVLNHLIKAKRDPTKRRPVMKLPGN